MSLVWKESIEAEVAKKEHKERKGKVHIILLGDAEALD